MPTFTKTADEVFDPLTGGGAPRGANMSEARTWGTEVEGALPAASSEDDIEVTAATPGSMSVTYNNRECRAVKIDTLVHLFGYIDVTLDSLTGASGTFWIGNLPYPVANTSGLAAFEYVGTAWIRGSGNAGPTYPNSGTGIVAAVDHQNDAIAFRAQSSGGASATGLLTVSNFTAGDRYVIEFHVMYETP